jgi:hypothetical protein
VAACHRHQDLALCGAGPCLKNRPTGPFPGRSHRVRGLGMPRIRAFSCRVCKTVGLAHPGSNPGPATTQNPQVSHGVSAGLALGWGQIRAGQRPAAARRTRSKTAPVPNAFPAPQARCALTGYHREAAHQRTGMTAVPVPPRYRVVDQAEIQARQAQSPGRPRQHPAEGLPQTTVQPPARGMRTSARTTTTASATSAARSPTTSGCSVTSASKSPSPASPAPTLTPPKQAPKQPDPGRHPHPAPLRSAERCRAPS